MAILSTSGDDYRPSKYQFNSEQNFVFSRNSFIAKDGTEWYGICGRDMGAWGMVFKDLSPGNNTTQPLNSKLVKKLNAGIELLSSPTLFVETLQGGKDEVCKLLSDAGKIKLAASFL